MNNLTVLQHGVGTSEILHRCFGKTTKDWAYRHGCGYVFSNRRSTPERTSYWEKPLFVYDEMCDSPSDKLWLDCDTFVVQPDKSPVGVLRDGADLAICLDKGMPFNSGLFFIRNNERTRAYMKAVYDLGDLPSDCFDQPRMIEQLQFHEINIQILPWAWNAAHCCNIFHTGDTQEPIIKAYHGWPHEARFYWMERLMSNKTKLVKGA